MKQLRKKIRHITVNENVTQLTGHIFYNLRQTLSSIIVCEDGVALCDFFRLSFFYALMAHCAWTFMNVCLKHVHTDHFRREVALKLSLQACVGLHVFMIDSNDDYSKRQKCPNVPWKTDRPQTPAKVPVLPEN